MSCRQALIFLSSQAMFWPRIWPIRKRWLIESKACMAPAQETGTARRGDPIVSCRFLAIDAYSGIIYNTIMPVPDIVIDTNVFIAALRSEHGASYRLLTLIDSGLFAANISVPLILEYEEVAKRMVGQIGLTLEDIDDVLDYICSVAKWRTVFYLWRPLLGDPQDDMILELAVVANCSYIVTYNRRDFQDAERFGIRVATPKAFLQRIGALP